MTNKTAMAAVFTEVTLDDMEKFLKRSFHALHPKKGVEQGEICYTLKVSKWVGIRVMTSIGQHGTTGAGSGEDAIRVGMISLKDEDPIERGKVRSNGRRKWPIVKRTKNWRDNLKNLVDDCLDKYDDSERFWDVFAETRDFKQAQAAAAEEARSHGHHPPSTEEERAKDEDGEGDGPSESETAERTPDRAPEPERKYDPSRMVGGITEAQMNYLRLLMKGMNQQKWESTGAAAITGFPSQPTRPSEVRGLSKGQASQLIDALLKKGGGGRYAAGIDHEKWKV